jgi:hypothetical protein
MNKESSNAVDCGTSNDYARRAFLRMTASTAGLLGVSALLSSCGDDLEEPPVQAPPQAPSAGPPPAAAPAVTDQDVLNFALILNYLPASFHSVAVSGSPLASNLTSGTGQVGTAAGGRRVSFNDPALASYAEEIRQREVQHVTQLRSQLGASAMAMPEIDLGTGTSGAFTRLTAGAGISVNGSSFDPYADQDNYLLGSYFFQDLMVTALKSAIRILPTRSLSEGFAGILAAKSYHAGLLRTLLIRRDLP